MDLTIKRDITQSVKVNLKEEQVEFMERFRALLIQENPEVADITDHEAYQKAFDILMADKRILQRLKNVEAQAKKTSGKGGAKVKTIADIKVKA